MCLRFANRQGARECYSAAVKARRDSRWSGWHPIERVAPPDRLGGDESTIWREIVASKPADWFGPDNPHLEASILTSSDYDLAAGVAKKLYFLGELCR